MSEEKHPRSSAATEHPLHTALQAAYLELKRHDADYHYRTPASVNSMIVDALATQGGSAAALREALEGLLSLVAADDGCDCVSCKKVHRAQDALIGSEPQTALDRKTIANAVEPILIRRLFERKAEGYTLPMSWEIADAILALSRPQEK